MTAIAWVRGAIPRRPLLFAVVAAIGLLLAGIHWVGVALGAALLSLFAPSTGRGLVYGAGFGVLVWLVFAVRQFWGSIGPYTDAATLLVTSAGIAIGLGLLGASVREVVRSTP
ncbi:MAG: hypothetical protein ABEJ76_04765 [Halanaeroarchaeum sp.]